MQGGLCWGKVAAQLCVASTVTDLGVRGFWWFSGWGRIVPPSVTLQSRGWFEFSARSSPLLPVQCAGVAAATCRCLCHSDMRGSRLKTGGKKWLFVSQLK